MSGLFGWDEVSLTFCPGCTQTTIFTISACWAARIVGISHCAHPNGFLFGFGGTRIWTQGLEPRLIPVQFLEANLTCSTYSEMWKHNGPSHITYVNSKFPHWRQSLLMTQMSLPVSAKSHWDSDLPALCWTQWCFMLTFGLLMDFTLRDTVRRDSRPQSCSVVNPTYEGGTW
jgi:hypothetical protein